MKLFGKDLLNFKKPGQLYNFAQWGFASDYGSIGLVVERQTDGFFTLNNGKKTTKKAAKPKTVIQLTPKGLFQTQALNSRDFSIATQESYITKQIADAKEKLALMPKASKKKSELWGNSGAVSFGRQELESIVERLENRRKIEQHRTVVDKYPHTTSQLIHELIETHKYLRCDSATSFVPDFPKEAIEAMKEYNDMCEKVCGKTTHFYVIANQKDFQERNKRRDPILLAQSPFGFFWQILGAWDEEMIYLGDL